MAAVSLRHFFASCFSVIECMPCYVGFTLIVLTFNFQIVLQKSCNNKVRRIPYALHPTSSPNVNILHNYISKIIKTKKVTLGFFGGAVVKNLPANAGDTGSSSGPGRSHMPRSN